ncbi:MAG: DUF1273 domain-containing protein [Clostridia bacterium]|nr:DUF1273 domain-containing protein [Clostridia bacterium]
MEMQKTCAFTGHRQVENDLDTELLEKLVVEFTEGGCNTFLCGMALGFDMIAAETVIKLKREYPHIKLIACVPCDGQSRYFPRDEKLRYDRIINECDDVKILSSRYYNGCMQARDRYMVDNSSVLIAYRRKNEGGTHYTVKYALSQNKRICLI